MKRWNLLVIILVLLVFFNIPLLLADDQKLLIVEPFKISDYTQLIVLPLDTSSAVLKENKIDIKPPEEVLQKANEFLVKGLKNNSPKKLNIIFNGSQDAPQTLILKIGIPKMGIEIAPSKNGYTARVEVRGDVLDAQSQKLFLQFKAKRDSFGTSGKEGYTERLLRDFKDIGEDISDLLDSKQKNIYPNKHITGKYTNWKRTCNEVEIVKPFNFKNYSRIIVKPLDTASALIPEKTNENDLHEPTLKYLSKIDKTFFETIQENMEEEENILDVVLIKGDNQIKDFRGKNLVLKGKVNKVDPGDPKIRDRGVVEIEGEVTDAQSNELLLKIKHEQTSIRGKSKSFEDFMRGSFEETIDAATQWNAKDICELLKKFK